MSTPSFLALLTGGLIAPATAPTPTPTPAPSAGGGDILLEDGTILLLEDGSALLLESGPSGPIAIYLDPDAAVPASDDGDPLGTDPYHPSPAD